MGGDEAVLGGPSTSESIGLGGLQGGGRATIMTHCATEHQLLVDRDAAKPASQILILSSCY